jgi:hypothetical protein
VAGTDSKHRADDTEPPQRRSRWWIAALTFVAGMVVGVLLVGLFDTRKPDFLSAVNSAPPATPSATAGQVVPAAGSAQVNAACLRVINEAQDVSIILGDVGPAVSAVDLQQLDDIVRQLQSIQPRLQRDLGDCRVEANVSDTPSAQESASPTPSATASPTR